MHNNIYIRPMTNIMCLPPKSTFSDNTKNEGHNCLEDTRSKFTTIENWKENSQTRGNAFKFSNAQRESRKPSTKIWLIDRKAENGRQNRRQTIEFWNVNNWDVTGLAYRHLVAEDRTLKCHCTGELLPNFGVHCQYCTFASRRKSSL